MKEIAAYLLAVLGGNANPSAQDLNHILASVGTEVDDAKIELLLSQVMGKDLTELIAVGREKFATIPSSRAALTVTATEVGGDEAGAAEANEEKVEEEEDDDMCFSLFD
ncbi:60S acidic ribosomal protein P2A [Hibiscus syriacus]|uniref:60S acidic ribosomal protein P2A n=1 Tax=Hibiscus syriacus TaxID=106335 RepID=A0A6A3BPX7_HIBSY|nr:60S acidic ribosomal protein P2A-like [Hibiscus syriacus]XP_039066093.1 60S acidic ribosomal protein P2A-like [Hibiscus syriacus]KAE8719018.1 60S acidic ribosomal protein P2A [Hibiscus syriacus]KAE8719020.1 60S acidic ribosomal protein P2A [Hibiscus syriacus]